ncbi:MAG TPA: winged helix-turn-helix domain-containing protein [Paracoccaceae bacterium]|nr:winged helix-turn-helix domain-containing protein [Paracoccaceae bacterium]
MSALFENDFRSAKIAEKEIVFTEAEARLLAYLSRYQGQTLSRRQILEGISNHDEDKSERSVDFLVNRVRRKLGEDVRNPRFIATRYGGGYVWLGLAAKSPDKQPEGNLAAVIGPIRGLEIAGANRDAGLAFANQLAEALRSRSAGNIVVDENYDPARQPSQGVPRFTVELLFLDHKSRIDSVLTCRSNTSGRVFFVRRLPLSREAPPYSANRRVAKDLVSDMLTERWRADTEHMSTSEPLAVAMVSAALDNVESANSVQEIDTHFAALEGEKLADPFVSLLYANHLHSKIVSNERTYFRSGPEMRVDLDSEIERRVLSAIPHCQSKPEMAVIAAKLLYYVDRRYKALALELAEKAYDESTSIATLLTGYGQLKAFTGDFDAALPIIRQAIALTEPGSRAQHYGQVILCQALIAANRRDELEAVRAEVYAYHPIVRLIYEPLMTEPDRPSLRARGVILAMSKKQVRSRLDYMHHISARLFEHEENRANSLRALVNLSVRRHGRSIVSEAIYTSVPSLFG